MVEGLGKVVQALEAEGFGYLGDRKIGVPQQLFCFVQSQTPEILHRRAAGYTFKFSGEVGLFQMCCCGKILQCDIFVEIFLHIA